MKSRHFLATYTALLLLLQSQMSLQAQDSFSVTVTPPSSTQIFSVELLIQHELLTLNEPVTMSLTLTSPTSESGMALVVGFQDNELDELIDDIATNHPPAKWPAGTPTPTNVGGHDLPVWNPAQPGPPPVPASPTNGVVTVSGTTSTVPVSSGNAGPHTEQPVVTVVTTVKNNYPHVPGNPQQSATNATVKGNISTLMEHAEGDAVAVSILGGDKDVEIFINNPNGPCPACQAAIPLIVKNGVKVKVTYPNGNGGTTTDTFTGTR